MPSTSNIIRLNKQFSTIGLSKQTILKSMQYIE